MSGAFKAGWFLVGLGVGILGTTIIFKREFEKPVGEVEEYIPLNDREESLDVSREANESVEEGKRAISSSEGNDISTEEGRRSERGREGGDNNREEDHQEFSSNQAEILDYYQSFSKDDKKPSHRSKRDKRRDEFEKRRGEGSPKKGTRYSRMYQDEAVEEALHVVNQRRRSRDSYDMNDDIYDEVDNDYPPDDESELPEYETDIHDEFTLERVEENIEIFLDDNPQDFVTMIFYQGDNTLCDDGEQIVPDAEDVIGLAALSRLIEGGPGAENGVIFVHNLKTSLNYEVVLDNGSYQDTVIGQFESRHNKDGGRDGNS